MQTIAVQAIQGLSESLVWPALLNSLWIGVLAACLVALAFQIRPRLSHGARHLALSSGLVVAVASPGIVALYSSATKRPGAETMAPLATAAGSSSSDVGRLAPTPTVTPAVTSRPSIAPRSWPIELCVGWISVVALGLSRMRTLIVTAWLVGAALSGGFLLLSAGAVRRLRREAAPAPLPVQQIALALARRLRLRNSPAILAHNRMLEPCLCGLFRPAILLPERWLASSAFELLEPILAHELAHARRLDHVANVFQRVVEAVFFFHPAVHWMSRSLRRQREFCTDRLAVRLTGDPLALARALESVARVRLISHSRLERGMSLGGESTSLLARIEELLGMTPSLPRFQLWPWLALPAAGLMALIVTSTAAAQDRPFTAAGSAVGKTAAAAANQPPAPEARMSVTVTAGPRPPEAMKRQISYEVRFLSLDAEPWRDHFRDQFELIKQEGDMSAWIIDAKAVRELLAIALADASSNVLQAPKATAFERNGVTIKNRLNLSYVSDVKRQKTANPSDLQLLPVVRSIEIGYELTMVGALLPAGTRLSVELQDCSLLAMRTLQHEERVAAKHWRTTYQVPSRIVQSCRTSCELPSESSLLISVGLGDRRAPQSRPLQAAGRLLETVGVPHVEPRSVTTERLVVITPRSIELDGAPEPARATTSRQSGPIFER